MRTVCVTATVLAACLLGGAGEPRRSELCWQHVGTGNGKKLVADFLGIDQTLAYVWLDHARPPRWHVSRAEQTFSDLGDAQAFARQQVEKRIRELAEGMR